MTTIRITVLAVLILATCAAQNPAVPCTCVKGTCQEDGNSCSSGPESAPPAPVGIAAWLKFHSVGVGLVAGCGALLFALRRYKRIPPVVVGLCLIAMIATGTVMKLTPEEFIVKAGSVRYWPFNVPESATGYPSRVVGRFRASGGARNDIRVLITDNDECENWVNGNGVRAFYDSGKKTVGQFDVALNPGGYCLLFENRNSVVSTKEVQATVSLIVN